MAWKEATQLTSSEGDVSSGILNDATGEFWYQRTDPESGQTMWRSTSGGLSAADPRGQDTLGGLLKYGNPTVMQGGEGGTTSIYTPNLESIGGFSLGNFQIRQIGADQWQAFNPKSGAWEQAYHVPESISGNNTTIVPQSLAVNIPGAAIFTNKPANNKGGFFEDYVLPTVIGGIATAGLGSMLGGGSLFSGSNALSGLSEAELANAGSGLGQGIEGAAIAAGPTMNTGANMGFLEELSGLSNFDPNGPVRALLPSENVSEWQAMQNNGSWGDEISNFGGSDSGSNYTIDMSGRAIDAAGNVVNGTDGGITDFIKGAIQSGNLSELAKVLPSIPGGSTALKSLFGGSGGSSSLWDIIGRAAPGLLGAYAANKQTSALTDLANKFSEYGAPSRARYEASMTPGFDPTSIPGYQGALDTASQTLLRKLSATGGNPYGNPGGLIEANKQIVSGTAMPIIQQYQNQNANTGGLGALAAAYPSTQAAATQSGANVYNALGSAIGNVVNPPQTGAQSLADIYKLLNSGMKAA